MITENNIKTIKENRDRLKLQCAIEGHEPYHTGPEEIICKRCGEPCSFAPVSERAQTETDGQKFVEFCGRMMGANKCTCPEARGGGYSVHSNCPVHGGAYVK